RAGERRLPAEDPVQLRRVADRLMDLERHLLATEDQVRRLERGAGVRAEQRPGLAPDARRLAGQVDLADELPAARSVLAADAGVGAPLGLTFADSGGVHQRAALDDVLVDVGALARHEPLAGVPDPVDR